MSGENSKKDWKKVREAHEEQLENESAKQDIDELIEEIEHPDAGSSALDHPSYKELEEKLTLAEQQAHEHWEKSVKALAELENVRRRAERDVENAHRYGLEKFVDSLIPVVDSLEQALQLAEQEKDSAMHEGLELTMKLFLDVLRKHGVEQLNPQGEPFDPQLHEAMSMQQSEDAKPNTVLAVFQRGYKLNDRVVRPARVIVAKGK
ncbi:nucleotide exchange factor GrpE [Legionella impletisoli]|uniref:Protein GrpE n=1 Tax=Legionella impletisoli TaxID=343510 RepID=A0A917JYX1_9GAMM|nr:nucleotide exchange factor GrpE [Legionella impletisoli]GGI89549.1 protein GrpE [Legionella impletisoli]